MEAASDQVDPRCAAPLVETDEFGQAPVVAFPVRRRETPAWVRAAAAALAQARVPVLVFLATRAVLVAAALLESGRRGYSFPLELANWDGMWFRWIAHHGYPAVALHGPYGWPMFRGMSPGLGRLGFFPLYPITIWLAAHVLFLSGSTDGFTYAGCLIAVLGGAAAVVLVQRLATGWWGAETGRRAALLFVLFPGSVVFLMSYSEGLLIPLAAGCILALERRRWLLAGVLAGFATATEPDAFALIFVCAVCAALELYRSGWRAPGTWRVLAAPLLSATGGVAFAAYLWAQTGTPFANYIAQHYGWGERSDVLALWHQAETFVDQLTQPHFNHPTINLNGPVGLLGAIVLGFGLWYLFRRPGRISVAAIAWTLAIGFLAVTSEYVPPNPRLLITAFPAVIVLANRFRGRAWMLVLAVNGFLLVGMSWLTFVGTTLRP